MSEGARARVAPAVLALSDDVLSNLYRHLPTRHDKASFSLVCRRWHRVVCHSRKTCHVWSPAVLPTVLRLSPQLTSIDCSGVYHLEDEHVEALTERYSSTLTDLNLTNNKQVSDAGLKALGRKCAHLTRLNLRNGTCSDLGIMGLAACSKLEVLQLANCRTLTDVGMSCLGARCKALKELFLHFCMGITNEGIGILTLNCPLLATLDLGYTQVSTGAMAPLAQAPSLKSLSLAGCSNVDDECIMELSQGCTRLEVLDVSGCSAVSSASLQVLASAGVPLRELLAGVCPQVLDPLVPQLAKFQFLSVLKLDLNEISNDGLLGLSKAYAALEQEAGAQWQCGVKELSVPKCMGIRDSGLLALLPVWPRLQHLNLTCCKSITDSVLLGLAHHAKGLLSLHVEGCSKLTADGIKHLVQGCTGLQSLDITDCKIVEEGLLAVPQCKDLRKVKLGFCATVTDCVLQSLGANCQRLVHLDLYRCQGFGAAGLGAVGAGCPGLQELNISYCLEGWTDASMVQFCARAASLKNIEMRGCRRVTSRGLAAMGAGCVALEELDLKKCTGIGTEGLLAIATGCPLLRQISLSYCHVSDDAMRALAAMSCMVKFNLIHCSQVSPQGLARALMLCPGLRKVKLLPEWKHTLPPAEMTELESRGCVFRWMAKPPYRDAEESLAGVVTSE